GELNARRFEHDLRVTPDVEEVRRAQVVVTLDVVGVEARDADRAGHPRPVSGIDEAVKVHEAAFDRLYHPMLHLELNARMRGIDTPDPVRAQLLRRCECRHFPYSFHEVRWKEAQAVALS